jgi:hypothetical protein
VEQAAGFDWRARCLYAAIKWTTLPLAFGSRPFGYSFPATDTCSKGDPHALGRLAGY